MCAVGLPEVKFINVVKRSPIDISAVPAQRYRLVHTHTHIHKKPDTHRNFYFTKYSIQETPHPADLYYSRIQLSAKV